MCPTSSRAALLSQLSRVRDDFRQPWRFYEVLDELLGPWGSNGYPLGYGRRYCRAFHAHPQLASHPVTRRWVRETTLLLQASLWECAGRLSDTADGAMVNEREFRRFAFAAHARAYIDAGLNEVLHQVPWAIPVILLIPWRELLPFSPDSYAAWQQVVMATSLLTTGENWPRLR